MKAAREKALAKPVKSPTTKTKKAAAAEHAEPKAAKPSAMKTADALPSSTKGEKPLSTADALPWATRASAVPSPTKQAKKKAADGGESAPRVLVERKELQSLQSERRTLFSRVDDVAGEAKELRDLLKARDDEINVARVAAAQQHVRDALCGFEPAC